MILLLRQSGRMSSTLLRWSVRSLGPQIVLRRAARAGQLGARIAVDRRLWDDPYPTYEQMRARGPLLRSRWLDTTATHRVAGEVLRSPAFRVGAGSPEHLPPLLRRLQAWTADPEVLGPSEPPSMLATDPPDHTRYRSLVARVFTPRALAALEPRVEEVATELLDGLERSAGPAGRAGVDLVAAYAGPLPVRIIAEILGVPPEVQPRMLAWGDAAAVTLDPAPGYRPYRRASAALREMHRWLGEHVAALRRAPGDDLLSRLVSAAGAGAGDDGRALSDVELRATALLVLGAGFETTMNLIATGAVLLVRHPEQRALLRAEPSRWPGAVDEILRYDAPVQSTLRIAARDVEVAGHAFPAGRFVSVMLGGANRDPEVFAAPAQFDVTRPNAREHLAFSAGVHFCLGAALARLDGAVALRLLFERFPDLALAGPPVRRPLRVLRGYSCVPVRPGARTGSYA